MRCKCGGALAGKGGRILKSFECTECGRVYDYWETILCIDPYMALIMVPTLYKRAIRRKDEEK
jgi:hypothetical protein